jgi:SpoVK/Ycf46/Vps4 family AAA+-type ATPase
MDAIDYLPRLIKAGLDSDRKLFESISITISKKIKKDHTKASEEIARALALSSSGNTTIRSAGYKSLPVDKETRYSLATFEEPQEVLDPVLDLNTKRQLDDFIREREFIEFFLADGIVPSNSILFVGQPGVGKTYVAHWLSCKLDIPLVILDLATSISSYLGRSGQNIKGVFDWAQTQQSILFLDEFDAIAKKRDDDSDLGELKRLVNVLLKEIEEYPKTGIIFAATNHPELLDKAIWRRFDRVITIDLPNREQREQLIARHMSSNSLDLTKQIRSFIAETTTGMNAADVCKLCEHIKRKVIMYPEVPIKLTSFEELFNVIDLSSKDQKKAFCKAISEEFPDLSLREISMITHIPTSSVSRYLRKDN